MRVAKCCGDFHVEIERIDLIDWTGERLEHKVFSTHFAAEKWRDNYLKDHAPLSPRKDAKTAIKAYLWYENPEDAE